MHNENFSKSNPPAATLAMRIQQLRRQRGLSQEELANAVNVSRQAVSKWEGAQAQPELEKLLALSDFFQVSTDYLLKGEQPAAAKQPTAPITTGEAPKAPLCLINATLFNYVGLLLGWALWDYWQLSLCSFLSIVLAMVGAAVLAARGLARSAPEA